MIRPVWLAVFTGVLIVWLPSLARAQRFGRDSEPRVGVCFYERSDFRGDYFCAEPGDSRDSVSRDVRRVIGSIRIFGRTEVEIFQDSNYRGRSRRFSSSIAELDRNWDDRISSFRVRSQGSGDRRPDNINAERIVRRAYQDILKREPDPAGMRDYRSRIIDDGWTERQVRDALRSSPEYRELTTMTRAKAQNIVAQAYRAVLKRDPDAGAEGFIQRVLNDGWSQRDVERELYKSDEYRNMKK